MKKYNKPELELITLYTEDTMDIITQSGFGGTLEDGNHNVDGSDIFKGFGNI